MALEAAVVHFDAPQQGVLPPQLVLQQPEVALHPEFVPVHFAPPQPLPRVDWAMIAYLLFTIAEHESQQRLN